MMEDLLSYTFSTWHFKYLSQLLLTTIFRMVHCNPCGTNKNTEIHRFKSQPENSKIEILTKWSDFKSLSCPYWVRRYPWLFSKVFSLRVNTLLFFFSLERGINVILLNSKVNKTKIKSDHVVKFWFWCFNFVTWICEYQYVREMFSNPVQEGFLDGPVDKESDCDTGDTGDPWLISGSGRSPGGRKWQLSPIFLPKRSHGQRRLASYHPECHRVRHDRVVTHAQVKDSCLFLTF